MSVHYIVNPAGERISVILSIAEYEDRSPPPNPLPRGEGEFSNSLFHKAPSPLVGEGWGEGCERLHR